MEADELVLKNIEEIAALKALVSDQARRLAELENWEGETEKRLHDHGKKLTVAMLFKDEHTVLTNRMDSYVKREIDGIKKMIDDLQGSSAESKWKIGIIITAALAGIKIAWDVLVQYLSGGHK